MTRDALDWLKRPIAHRGLHDAAHGIVENSASAVEAATWARRELICNALRTASRSCFMTGRSIG
jgi:hypothetical protein